MINVHLVYSVQCSVCIIKCTGAGAGACAGAVYILQCAACSVLPATGEIFALKSNRSNLNFILKNYFSKANSSMINRPGVAGAVL